MNIRNLLCLTTILPAQFAPCPVALSDNAAPVTITLSHNDAPVGPFGIPANAAGPLITFSPPGTPATVIVWVKP